MRGVLAVCAAALLAGAAPAQELPPISPTPTPASAVVDDVLAGSDWVSRPALKSNQNFPDFIGFMTNPLQAIDPRSLTQIWPVFISSWWNPSGPLPGGNGQIYGAGLNLAITDRFSVGLNQGGGAVLNFSPVATRFPQLDDRINSFRGTRVGWVNLGGFAQYTLVEDVEDRFLLTVGSRLEVPTGESSVFQGHGQPVLSPYFTVGKGWGNWHVLNTTGYGFSLGKGRDTTSAFYGTVHVDYKLGWLYPLLELNWGAFTKEFTPDLPFDRGLANFGTANVTGSYATLSPGVNAVLIPGRLELGGAYTTKLASERNVDLNAMIVKMVIRY